MPVFEPSDPDLTRPIRDLGLAIAGSRLEPIAEEFLAEVRAVGLSAVSPRLYLSTEWGVPDGTIAIAIPFYLVSDELTELHAARAGHVEGRTPADVLRYLRHEMGHVVNYAYHLFETEGWIGTFGAMSNPYREEYHPVPFSRDFVRHLPGWYAQKHPDEDWAETFAVWMTPKSDWRAEYESWPVALEKLRYCDRAMSDIAGRKPLTTADDLDEDVSEIGSSLHDFYAEAGAKTSGEEGGIDGALRTIFDEPGDLPAAALVRRLRRDVAAEVYRWVGAFPELTGPMLDRMASRCEALGLSYEIRGELANIVGLAAFVAAWASGEVARGRGSA